MYSLYDEWILIFYDRLESIPSLTAGDVAVYFALLTIARAAGGTSREFSAAIRNIESKSRVRRSSLYESLNRLQQNGLIQYKKGFGRIHPKFSLCPPFGHYAGRNTGRYAGRNTGHLDDIRDDDDIYTLRAREAWKDAFGEAAAGVVLEELDGWAHEWDIGLLTEAFCAAALAGASNRMGYIRTTLADWKRQNIRTPEQWAEMQARFDGLAK